MIDRAVQFRVQDLNGVFEATCVIACLDGVEKQDVAGPGRAGFGVGDPVPQNEGTAQQRGDLARSAEPAGVVGGTQCGVEGLNVVLGFGPVMRCRDLQEPVPGMVLRLGQHAAPTHGVRGSVPPEPCWLRRPAAAARG